MARQVIESVVDDLDGSPNATTVLFSLDNVQYSIDLSAKNEEKLRQALNPYLENATRVRGESGRGRRLGAGRGTGDKDRNQAIRQWALENGVELASRGRISGAVQQAYDAADVPALFAAAGIEMEKAPRRGRRRSADAEFSSVA